MTRAAGGNATNAASVCAQLLQSYGNCTDSVHLVAPVSDPSQDGDAAALRDELKAVGVCTRGLVTVAPTGLPTSYIALAPNSRTILHARTIRELVGGEAAAALRCAICNRESTCFTWVHAEGRALEATAAAFAALRAKSGDSADMRPILSLELEKSRADGNVEAVLLPLADVVFISREYASLVHGLADAPAAIAYVLASAAACGAVPALVVAPWGAAGAWASAAGAAPGAPRIVAHSPAHAPPQGDVVDTLGAGDTFIAAFIARAVATHAAAPILAGAARGTAVLEPTQLADWLASACRIAGDKVGHQGLALSSAARDDIALTWPKRG